MAAWNVTQVFTWIDFLLFKETLQNPGVQMHLAALYSNLFEKRNDVFLVMQRPEDHVIDLPIVSCFVTELLTMVSHLKHFEQVHYYQTLLPTT